MKSTLQYRQLLYVIFGILFLVRFSGATIRILDRDPNNSYAFHTTQSAHDGSNSGDTIVVVGYATYYGNVVANRPLHWIGTGYMLSQLSPAPMNANDPVIGYMDINSGAEGTVVEGLGTFLITINTNDVTIRKCWPSGVTVNARNALIEQCFFINYNMIVNNQSSAVIRNNYFTSLTVVNGANFVTCNNNYMINVNVYNTSLSSNYIVNTPNLQMSVLSMNNMSAGDVGSFNGNVSFVPITNVIVQTGSISYDRYYQIRVDSPTIGNGYNGVDIGPYGGSTPYVLSGRLPVPTIISVSTTGHANSSSGLQVIITAQARN